MNVIAGITGTFEVLDRPPGDCGGTAEPTVSDVPRCCWCSRPFQARQSGGRPQKFCLPSCRRAFHAAGRSWVLDRIASGALTVADIRNGPPATRTLITGVEATQPVVSRWSAASAPASRCWTRLPIFAA